MYELVHWGHQCITGTAHKFEMIVQIYLPQAAV